MKQKLTAVITQEDDMFVSLNPETGVSSQGKSIEEALDNLREALELYFEETGEQPVNIHQTAFLTTALN